MAKRSRARDRKKERQQEKKRNQRLLIVGVIVVVVIFIAASYLLTSVPADAPLPTTLSRYENLQRGFTDKEGYPRLGNPNAPVKLTEFSSFACSHCLEFEQNVFVHLLPRIESGEIQFIFVPLETGSGLNANGANRTALCAGEQGKFWEMHDTLFSWQSIFGDNAFQDNRLRAGVSALGLSLDVFNSCFRSAAIDAVLLSAQGEDVTSTPTVHIDGAPVDNPQSFDEIAALIDAKGPFTDLEPGTISDVNAEATATTDEVEATAEATETMVDEATEEAVSDTTLEATSEATEPVEATAESTESSD